MHPGMVRMKSLAEIYALWLGLDADIEDCVRNCRVCSQVSNTPKPASPFPWPWATHPWQRIHIDYAEKEGQNFLVVVDSQSKWLEVVAMFRTTAVRLCNFGKCSDDNRSAPENLRDAPPNIVSPNVPSIVPLAVQPSAIVLLSKPPMVHPSAIDEVDPRPAVVLTSPETTEMKSPSRPAEVASLYSF